MSLILFRERSDPALSFSDGKSAYRSGKHPSLDNIREGAESGGEASHPDISTLPGYHLLSPCEIKVSLHTSPYAAIVDCSAVIVSKMRNRPLIITCIVVNERIVFNELRSPHIWQELHKRLPIATLLYFLCN
jgi:hypothetical protein